MKSKVLLTIFISIFCLGFFSGFLVNISSAEDKYYEISIIEKNYEISSIKDIKGRTFVFFNISITLKNSGNMISDDITLEIVGEDEMPLYKNYTIPAEGYKEFTFDEFYLQGLGEHQVNLSYYPTNIDNWNDYNHGKDVLILQSGGNGDDSSTPGFEAIFLIMTIVVYVFLTRYKK